MIDSTGKLPDGILVGHTVPLGNMKECKDIEVSKPESNGERLDSFVYVSIYHKYVFFIIKKN